MTGRIFKEKGKFYCVIGYQKIPVLLDSKNKLRHGDLVQISSLERKNNFKVIRSSKIRIIETLKKQLFNLDSQLSLNERLRERILDLRSPRNHSIYLIKSETLRLLREIFYQGGFIEVNTPTILGGMTDGRVEKFDIDFYGKKAFLAMTKLLYLRLLVCSDFEKVFEIQPVFVAGNFNTPNHVSEFITVDWADSNNGEDIQSTIKFVNSTIEQLLKKNRSFTKIIDHNIFDLKPPLMPKSPPIVTYDELIKIHLNKYPDEKDIVGHRHLTQKIINTAENALGNYFWIIDFPENFKQFYCSVDERKKLLAGELWWNKTKIASVGFSDSNAKKTLERLKLLGLNEKKFRIYLKAINCASNNAVLGSINLERLMMVLLNLKNIREVIMFPRSKHQAVLEP
jgi:aspartyl-tRNA synthetase